MHKNHEHRTPEHTEESTHPRNSATPESTQSVLEEAQTTFLRHQMQIGSATQT